MASQHLITDQSQLAQQKKPPTPSPDGSKSAVDNPNSPPGPYGTNNENLPVELQSALRMLIEQFRIEGLVARRHEILKTRRARYYWMGQQYLWFDWDIFDWRLPYQGGATIEDDKENQEQPRYNYVLNIYQPFGLAFIAVFSSQIPTIRWYPQSLNRSNDITAAKASSNISDLIADNNEIQQQLIKIGRLLWTDGKIGGYVRYVADKERFGDADIPAIQEGFAKMGEDGFQCPNCGQNTPLSSFALGGEDDSPAQMEPNPTCPNCNTPLGADNYKAAPRVAVPMEGNGAIVANGQEVMDFYGSLELATPPWCNSFWDFPWLQLQFEAHKGKLKATYPWAADKIQTDSAANAEDVYARASRLSVAQGLPVLHPGDVMYNLITYTQTWLRPWAFEAMDNKDQAAKLKELFPDGAYVAFAGQTYCASRNEKMSDHWRVMHAMPGDGQNRPAVGEASLDPQDQINTLGNMAIESFEYGIPPLYADPEVLDFESLTQRTVEPGVHVPARAKAGQQLANAFFQPAPAVVPEELFKYIQELYGPLFQLVTGVTAAVFGGSMDDVKTAKAYQQARDMSLGRLSISWNAFKYFYADMMKLAVDCFRKNRPGDLERVIPGENSEFEAQEIRLADLDGNTVCRPEPDETYPRLRAQKQNVLQQLMSLNAPEVAAILSQPENLMVIKAILGLNDLTIPGEDSETKQLREIEMMLKNPGVVAPVRLFDNHDIEIERGQRWFASDDGQTAADQNPTAYQAIEQHIMQHMTSKGQLANLVAATKMSQQPQSSQPQPNPGEQPQPEQAPPQVSPV